MKKATLLTLLLFTGLSIYAQSPSWQWASTIKTTYQLSFITSCPDKEGNVYTVGETAGNILVAGNDTIQYPYNYDEHGGFLAKYDQAGNLKWLSGIIDGLYALQTNASLCVDQSNNIYIAGNIFGDTVILGNDTIMQNQVGHPYLAKYNTQGDILWTKTLNHSGDMGVLEIFGLNSDNQGNIYVNGALEGSYLIFNDDTISSLVDAGFTNFIVKYDSSGKVLWAKTAGYSDLDDDIDNISIAVNNTGIYIAGVYNTYATTVGDITLVNAGAQNIFVAKMDLDGNVLWANTTSGAYYNDCSTLGVDSIGNLYISGNYNSPQLIFGDDTITNTNANEGDYSLSDIYIAKYETNGNFAWVKDISSNSSEATLSAISVESNGNFYITGSFKAPFIVFGKDTLNGGPNCFLTKCSPSGNFIASINVGSTIYPFSLSLDNYDNCYLAGYFSANNIILGPDTLTNLDVGNNPGAGLLAKYGIADAMGIAVNTIAPNPITVYPNPSPGQFYFKGIIGASMLQIYDVLGQTIYSSTVTGENYMLNIGAQAKGMYFFRVVNNYSVSQQGKIVLE